MLISVLENGLSIRKVADLLTWYKKIIPTLGVETPDAQLQRDLERLALSAPHVLADLGFEQDLKASTSEKAVWRRGTHSVIIYSPKHAAAFV
ncbi:hypothetical protein [Pacificoceanicola onchidii]|uniref:hypothetical protein n=1 Tax=Pacificoceanicola onchidii TaxID=2562685 RepID=UPI0010A6225A|nr:hypothetical protein [Pacificoceanicola onchidii]